jgi:hypothetical protein
MKASDWSPAEIVKFLEVYACPGDDTKAWFDRNPTTVQKWLDAALIAKCPDTGCDNCPTGYCVTTRGCAWVGLICSVSLPTLAWLDEKGKFAGPAGIEFVGINQCLNAPRKEGE